MARANCGVKQCCGRFRVVGSQNTKNTLGKERVQHNCESDTSLLWYWPPYRSLFAFLFLFGFYPFIYHTARKSCSGGALAGKEHLTLNMIKILLQMCLTTLNVVCWFVPMKIRSFVESKRAIGMANAFSGGVFLSLAFGEPVNLQHGCGIVALS